MDTKKVLIISAIAVIVIVSVILVTSGLLDGLLGAEQDNVIEIDNIQFNTTNVSKFVLINETKDYVGYYKWYMDENDSGYNVHIYNCSGLDYENYVDFLSLYMNNYNNAPSQTINGVVIYTISANTGDDVGETRYVAYIENRDLKTIIDFGSSDPNETAKMASSLKFK